MRAFAIVLAIILLGGCRTFDCPSPSKETAAKSREAIHADLDSSIGRWKTTIVPLARASKDDPRLKNDPQVGVLYTTAAASINQFIDAYAFEVRKGGKLNCQNLEDVAQQTDKRVSAFVRYTETGGQSSAVEWIALAPVIKDLAIALFDKYRDTSKEDRETFVAALESTKVKESIGEL